MAQYSLQKSKQYIQLSIINCLHFSVLTLLSSKLYAHVQMQTELIVQCAEAFAQQCFILEALNLVKQLSLEYTV